MVKNCIIALSFFILLLAFVLFFTYLAHAPTEKQRYGMYEVAQVDGGGNIVVDKGDTARRVFLIGVDAGYPDSQEGKNATRYVREITKDTQISLEYDIAKNKQNTLGVVDYAYVYLDDGRMLNAVLIAEGITDYAPDNENTRYNSDFRKLKEQAQHKKSGIWGNDPERNEE